MNHTVINSGPARIGGNAYLTPTFINNFPVGDMAARIKTEAPELTSYLDCNNAIADKAMRALLGLPTIRDVKGEPTNFVSMRNAILSTASHQEAKTVIHSENGVINRKRANFYIMCNKPKLVKNMIMHGILSTLCVAAGIAGLFYPETWTDKIIFGALPLLGSGIFESAFLRNFRAFDDLITAEYTFEEMHIATGG